MKLIFSWSIFTWNRSKAQFADESLFSRAFNNIVSGIAQRVDAETPLLLGETSRNWVSRFAEYVLNVDDVSLCAYLHSAGNQHETSIKFARRKQSHNIIRTSIISIHVPKWVHDPNTIEEWLLSDACKALMNGATNKRMSERKTKKRLFEDGFPCNGNFESLSASHIVLPQETRSKSPSV